MTIIKRLAFFLVGALVLASACGSPAGPSDPPPVPKEITVTVVYIRVPEKASSTSPNEFGLIITSTGHRSHFQGQWNPENQTYTVNLSLTTGVNYNAWVIDFAVTKANSIGSGIYLKTGEVLTLLPEVVCSFTQSTGADNRCVRIYFPTE